MAIIDYGRGLGLENFINCGQTQMKAELGFRIEPEPIFFGQAIKLVHKFEL